MCAPWSRASKLSMALHSRWMAVQVDTIHATGGAAVNREILQVMADVFGASVFQLPVGQFRRARCRLTRRARTSAPRGSIADTWADVIAGLAEPLAISRVDPNPDRHAMYRDMMPVYAACEAHARGRGPDPRQ